MDAIIELIHSETMQSVSWTLIHSIWQGLAIIFIVSILLKIVAKNNAQMRYFILINALLVFLFSVIVTFTIVNQSTDYGSSSLESITKAEASPVNQLKDQQTTSNIDKTLSPYLAFLLLWFIGVFVMSIRLLSGLVNLNRLKKNSSNIYDQKFIDSFNELVKRLGVTQKIAVYSSTIINSPLTYGFFKPIVLIPISLLSELSIEQLELIISHELVHIRRRDYLVNIIQSCVEVLFFFNPAVWWLSNKIRKETENCCDDGVVEYFDPFQYSKTLTQVESNRIKLQEQQLYLSASNGKNLLLNRIQRIMEVDIAPKKSNITSKVMVSLILVGCLSTISWIAPKEKGRMNTAKLTEKIADSAFIQEMDYSTFIHDSSYIASIEYQRKKLIAAASQLEIKKDELAEVLEILAKEKKLIAQSEQEIQIKLNAIMADSGNTAAKEVALVEEMLALEISEIQIQNLEKSIEKLKWPIDSVKNSALRKATEQMQLANLELRAQFDNMKSNAQELANEGIKLKERSEKLAQQNVQLNENLELIENELLKQNLIDSRNYYEFRINKTELFINKQKQSQELFELFNSLLEKEELQITK